MSRTPIVQGNEHFPRAFVDQHEIDTNWDNPQGVVLNTGPRVPIGEFDPDEVADKIGVPMHDIFSQYERCAAPNFRQGRLISQGLWQFSDWDILLTTRYDQITPAGREAGVDQVPFTTYMAFPHCRTRQQETNRGLDWVLGR